MGASSTSGRTDMMTRGKLRGPHAAALLAACLINSASGAASAGDGEELVTADALAAMVAAPVDGRASRDVWKGSNFLVLQSARVAPGAPELHERLADLFVVQAGAADVRIGGELKGDTATTAGERRGGIITGWHVRHVEAGDVLRIPAGVPHQVMPAPGAPFRYLVVKIADESAKLR